MGRPRAASFGPVPAEPASDKALDALMVKGWPRAKVPAGLPECTAGTIVNSGGDATTFSLKVRKTSETTLSGCVTRLKQAGWSVREDRIAPSVRVGG